MNKALGWIFDFFANHFELFKDFFQWFFGMIRVLGDTILASLFSVVSSLVPAAPSLASWNTVLEGINYFFPLSESIVMLTAYGVLWTGLVSYRLKKSWLPSVSGT